MRHGHDDSEFILVSRHVKACESKLEFILRGYNYIDESKMENAPRSSLYNYTSLNKETMEAPCGSRKYLVVTEDANNKKDSDSEQSQQTNKMEEIWIKMWNMKNREVLVKRVRMTTDFYMLALEKNIVILLPIERVLLCGVD